MWINLCLFDFFQVLTRYKLFSNCGLFSYGIFSYLKGVNLSLFFQFATVYKALDTETQEKQGTNLFQTVDFSHTYGILNYLKGVNSSLFFYFSVCYSVQSSWHRNARDSGSEEDQAGQHAGGQGWHQQNSPAGNQDYAGEGNATVSVRKHRVLGEKPPEH